MHASHGRVVRHRKPRRHGRHRRRQISSRRRVRRHRRALWPHPLPHRSQGCRQADHAGRRFREQLGICDQRGHAFHLHHQQGRPASAARGLLPDVVPARSNGRRRRGRHRSRRGGNAGQKAFRGHSASRRGGAERELVYEDSPEISYTSSHRAVRTAWPGWTPSRTAAPTRCCWPARDACSAARARAQGCGCAPARAM